MIVNNQYCLATRIISLRRCRLLPVVAAAGFGMSFKRRARWPASVLHEMAQRNDMHRRLIIFAGRAPRPFWAAL